MHACAHIDRTSTCANPLTQWKVQPLTEWPHTGAGAGDGVCAHLAAHGTRLGREDGQSAVASARCNSRCCALMPRGTCRNRPLLYLFQYMSPFLTLALAVAEIAPAHAHARPARFRTDTQLHSRARSSTATSWRTRTRA